MLGSHRGHCERALLATFNLGARVIEGLDQLLGSGHLDTADLVLSSELDHLGDSSRTYNALTSLALEYRGRFRWSARHTHAKVVAAYMECGDCFVVIGSGNLSTHNTRHESYVILNSRRAADHMARWIGELMREQ